MVTKKQLPGHIAIIMDGNGRWAKKKNLPRTQGHIEGIKRVEEIVAHARKSGIKVLTLFMFSSENWSRPKNEVSLLMRMFTSALKHKVLKLHQTNVKVRFLGRRDRIPKGILGAMVNAERLTQHNAGLIFNMAFNYGGRLEILDAVKHIARDVKDNNLEIDHITEKTISDALYTQGLPDPDLLIRTSGEQRISNFLIWQLSYTEFYFTNKFWPEFDTHEFDKAITDFQNRERRYGGIRAKVKVG